MEYIDNLLKHSNHFDNNGRKRDCNQPKDFLPLRVKQHRQSRAPRTNKLMYQSKHLYLYTTLTVDVLGAVLGLLTPKCLPSYEWPSGNEMLLGKMRSIELIGTSNRFIDAVRSFVLGNNEQNRQWTNEDVGALELILAGFRYTGEKDIVFCPECGIREDVTCWKDNDEDYGLNLHRKRFPNCPFIRNFGGTGHNTDVNVVGRTHIYVLRRTADIVFSAFRNEFNKISKKGKALRKAIKKQLKAPTYSIDLVYNSILQFYKIIRKRLVLKYYAYIDTFEHLMKCIWTSNNWYTE